jgi:hypothetical protein
VLGVWSEVKDYSHSTTQTPYVLWVGLLTMIKCSRYVQPHVINIIKRHPHYF